MSITHAITDRKEWHFPSKGRLSIKADANSFDVPIQTQIELKKDAAGDAEFYEVLIAKPRYEMYTKIANATDVMLQFGVATFKLDAESIASYRDFIIYLSPAK